MATDPRCTLRCKHLSVPSPPAALRLSSYTGCLFPPPGSLLPRPPQHHIVHPFGTNPRRGKGRSSTPGRKVGQSSSCRKGRKKEGRKEVANRRRWNPVGGLCIVLTPFLFSAAKSSPRSSQNQGSAAISQNPCLGLPAPTWRGLSALSVDVFKGDGQSSECAVAYNISISFGFFFVQQSQLLFCIFFPIKSPRVELCLG